MDINQDTRERIISAANQLFEQAGRADFPTVDTVRRLAKTNMGDTSAVMKEWRKMQTATAAPVAVTVPDRVQQASQAALVALWGDAQEMANESLRAAQTAWDAERAEAETLRGELSAAFESQASELDALQARFTELEAAHASAAATSEQQLAALRGQVATATERTNTAETRAVEIERRADDLKAALAAEQNNAKETAARLDAALSELASVKAKAEAAQEQHAEQRKRAEEDARRNAERIDKAEADREKARNEAASAREEAARLRGQVEAVQSQQAELMRVIASKADVQKTPKK